MTDPAGRADPIRPATLDDIAAIRSILAAHERDGPTAPSTSSGRTSGT